MDTSSHTAKLDSPTYTVQTPPGSGPSPTIFSRDASREDKGTFGKLEENHIRPVGAGSSPGVQTRANKVSRPVAHSFLRDGQQVYKVDLGGNSVHAGKRSHTMCPTKRGGRFLFTDLSSPKKRRKLQTSGEPASTKQVHLVPTLQNGGNPHCEGPLKDGGLYDQNRSKGCVLFSPHPHPAQQVSALSMERPGLRVLMPAFWSGLCAASLYKGNEANCSLPTEQGDSMCNLPRRSAAYTPRQRGTDGTHIPNIESLRSPRFSGKLSEVSTGTIPDNRLPRVCDRLSEERAPVTKGESLTDKSGGYKTNETKPCLSKGASDIDREADSSYPSSLSSPSALQEPPSAQTPGTSISRLRWEDESIPGSKGGSPVVVQQPVPVEWAHDDPDVPPFVNRDRCIQDGMGGILPRRIHGGVLEHRGTKFPYQCSGVASRFLCSKSFPEEEARDLSLDSVRQHVSGFPYKQDGRNKIPRSGQFDKENVLLVSTKTDQCKGTTPSWKVECHSRLPLQTSERQNRLDSQDRYFQSYQSSVGPPPGRSVCNSFFYTATAFLQLEGGSRGGGNRRFCSELGDDIGLCTPSLVPHFKSIEESSDGGSNNSTSNSSLENPTLVPYDHKHVGRPTNTSAEPPRPNHSISQLRLSSVEHSVPTCRMEGLRQRFRSREIPVNAISLIMSSWRSKTNANYNSAWKKWEVWCKQRGAHPFSADVSSILGFLADQFEDGKQYRSLNCYRSALSSTHLPIEGFPIGQHPLVVRLMKGAYNQRPPKPRYDHTWDVTQMLTYLRSLGSNEGMSLKLLTQKLTMLLALVLGHRSSDLVRLTLNGHRYTPEGVVLPCKGLAKQTRPGNEQSLQPVTITSFEDELLCPVACLRVYESATSKFRKSESSMQLFLAMVPPHHPVTSSTIARWIKKSLEKAGLEPVFSAHSTRSAASTAAALSGVSTQEIMDRAGWSSKDTFCKFYYRPQSKSDAAKRFGNAVLSYKHAKDMLIEPKPLKYNR